MMVILREEVKRDRWISDSSPHSFVPLTKDDDLLWKVRAMNFDLVVNFRGYVCFSYLWRMILSHLNLMNVGPVISIKKTKCLLNQGPEGFGNQVCG